VIQENHQKNDVVKKVKLLQNPSTGFLLGLNAITFVDTPQTEDQCHE